MTPYPPWMPLSLLSKLFEFSLIGSFLRCFWQLQKVVRHIPRVYISWRPPHPAESSTTSCRIFQGPQNDQMLTISYITTCPAIHTHLIIQFACKQPTFHCVKGNNRATKSRSGDGSRHLGMWWTIVLHISWSTVVVLTQIQCNGSILSNDSLAPRRIGCGFKNALITFGITYMRNVSPQLSCDDTCQIWVWFKAFDRYVSKREILAY